MVDDPRTLPLFRNAASEWKLPNDAPSTLGGAKIQYRDFGSILTRASGFVEDYDFVLNPYSGCQFSCSYCYAAFFSRDKDLHENWGCWVEVKQNAIDKLRNLRRRLTEKRIYMSTVTDPYQGIEARLGLVRSLVETLLEHQPRLVVQTRSPLVLRDVDLYQRFRTVRINMTVTTDSDEVRRTFEPRCPTNEARLRAIEKVARQGIPTSITLTPLLPVENPREHLLVCTGDGTRRVCEGHRVRQPCVTRPLRPRNSQPRTRGSPRCPVGGGAGGRLEAPPPPWKRGREH